jgi:hypothetical protein
MPMYALFPYKLLEFSRIREFFNLHRGGKKRGGIFIEQFLPRIPTLFLYVGACQMGIGKMTTP